MVRLMMLMRPPLFQIDAESAAAVLDAIARLLSTSAPSQRQQAIALYCLCRVHQNKLMARVGTDVMDARRQRKLATTSPENGTAHTLNVVLGGISTPTFCEIPVVPALTNGVLRRLGRALHAMNRMSEAQLVPATSSMARSWGDDNESLLYLPYRVSLVYSCIKNGSTKIRLPMSAVAGARRWLADTYAMNA